MKRIDPDVITGYTVIIGLYVGVAISIACLIVRWEVVQSWLR